MGVSEEDEEESKEMTIGSLVHTLVFEPDEYDNKYYESQCPNQPTAQTLTFVNHLLKHFRNHSDESGQLLTDFQTIAQLAYEDTGFKREKFETVLGKFLGSDAELYFKDRLNSEGKTVITDQDRVNANRIYSYLIDSPNSGAILTAMTQGEIEVFDELKVDLFNVNGLPLKMMTDKVIINHANKTIQPYDLKVVWSVENFVSTYHIHKYGYLQVATYDEGLRQHFRSQGLVDYGILPMKLIVADSIGYYHPLVYKLSGEDLREAKHGFMYKEKWFKGLYPLIEDLLFAKENDIWGISRENYLLNGEVPLIK